MAPEASLPPDYFERMFAADPDPWRFETSDYEAAKYDRTIAALGDRRYGHALEIGCANGVLTRRFAGRAQDLLAIDVSADALASAGRRCVGENHVRFARMVFPRETPDGGYDLVAMSEVVYYWGDADIAQAGRWLSRALDAGGDLLLVHWTGATDYPQSGDAAVAKLEAAIAFPLRVVVAERSENYRLDLWRRAS